MEIGHFFWTSGVEGAIMPNLADVDFLDVFGKSVIWREKCYRSSK
jgi:hypothetical protein